MRPTGKLTLFFIFLMFAYGGVKTVKILSSPSFGNDYVSDVAFKDRLEAELLKLPSYQSSIFIKFKANFPEEYSNLLGKTVQQVRGHKNDNTAFNVSNSLIREFLLKHKEEILISPDANFQEFMKSQIEFIETAQQTNVKKCAEFLNGVVKNEFNDTQSQQLLIKASDVTNVTLDAIIASRGKIPARLVKPTQEDNMFVMNRLRENGFTDKELSEIFDIAALSKMDDDKRCKLGLEILKAIEILPLEKQRGYASL